MFSYGNMVFEFDDPSVGEIDVSWPLSHPVRVPENSQIYDNKELPIWQILGIIALIPKSDKDLRYIKNWRPLTLLETF